MLNDYVGDGNTIYGTGMHGKIDRGDVLLDKEELKSKYIKPFKEAIENNVGSIMVSYNAGNLKSSMVIST